MKILIPLADGLEEIEAITNIDVLKRAGINVITAGLASKRISGAHNVVIEADELIEDVNIKDFDGIILPGGLPGATNLRDNKTVINIVKKMNKEEKLVSAICAAPIVLEKAGVIEDKNATSYPGFESQMDSCNYSEDRVVRDGNIITGRGPGVAMEFALAIVAYLMGEDKKIELQNAMLV